MSGLRDVYASLLAQRVPDSNQQKTQIVSNESQAVTEHKQQQKQPITASAVPLSEPDRKLSPALAAKLAAPQKPTRKTRRLKVTPALLGGQKGVPNFMKELTSGELKFSCEESYYAQKDNLEKFLSCVEGWANSLSTAMPLEYFIGQLERQTSTVRAVIHNMEQGLEPLNGIGAVDTDENPPPEDPDAAFDQAFSHTPANPSTSTAQPTKTPLPPVAPIPSSPMKLTEEQQKMIEQKRLAALERRRKAEEARKVAPQVPQSNTETQSKSSTETHTYPSTEVTQTQASQSNVDPQNHFSQANTETQTLTTSLCVDAPHCISDPPITVKQAQTETQIEHSEQ